MNRRLVLLFTRDPNFQKLLAEALLKEDLNVLVTRSVDTRSKLSAHVPRT